jgi:elongation factor G
VLDTGFLAGFPLQDLRVVVYDGKSHPVDSKEVAFIAAGRKAFLDALAKARAIVLEPIVSMEVVTPDANMGDVAGDLAARRGHLKGQDAPRPGTVKISALAPLSEMEGFASRLKSLTAGHGSYALEFSHYEPAPPQLQQKLVAQHKPAAAVED